MNWADELIMSCDLGFEETKPTEFYRALFGYSRSYAKYLDNFEVPLTFSDFDGEGGGTWRSVKISDICEFSEDRNDAYISPCTYFPKRGSDGRYHSTNNQDTAEQLCAFVLDIDKVDVGVFRNYLEYIWRYSISPTPSYVVTSGNGLHLYYILDWPVDMMRRWRMELKAIKDYLGSLYSSNNPSFALVEGFSSDNPSVSDMPSVLGEYDNLGLTQSFRVVGSRTKDGKDSVTAWRIGSTWDIDDLAKLAGIDQRFTVDEFDMSSSMQTKVWHEEAERRKERKSQSTGKGKKKKGWNPGLHKWLVRQVKNKGKFYGMYGHRYHQVLCLTITSRKDNIPRDQLEKDVKEAFEIWNDCAKRWGHPKILWSECQKAMKSGYKCDPYFVKKFKKGFLSDKCGWEWESHQKRNGRSQEEHLKETREWIEFKHRNDSVSWQKERCGRKKGTKDSQPRKPGSGRTTGSGTKKQLILDYASTHPGDSQRKIASALGVSPTTVNKWLKEVSDVNKEARIIETVELDLDCNDCRWYDPEKLEEDGLGGCVKPDDYGECIMENQDECPVIQIDGEKVNSV